MADNPIVEQWYHRVRWMGGDLTFQRNILGEIVSPFAALDDAPAQLALDRLQDDAPVPEPDSYGEVRTLTEEDQDEIERRQLQKLEDAGMEKEDLHMKPLSCYVSAACSPVYEGRMILIDSCGVPLPDSGLSNFPSISTPEIAPKRKKT